MNTVQAVVLGIIQGLTEFLPVSSTGHLRIVPALLGWSDPGAAFTAVTQLGTMAAVLIYFRNDLVRVLGAFLRGLVDPAVRRTPDSLMGWYIAIGTIPIVVAGVLFSDVIERGVRSLTIIGGALVLFSAVMLYAEHRATQSRSIATLNLRDGIIIGIAQALALIPGVSRSGATISAGLLLGFDRAAAARYSFLLSVPAVVLSGLYELRKIGDGGTAGIGATAVATVLAFVVGYASIALLLRFLVGHSLRWFVAYRVLVGSIVIVLAQAGAIS